MRAIELYVSDSTLGPLQRYDYSVVANTIDAGDILYSESSAFSCAGFVPVGYLRPTGGGYSANDASYGLTAG